MIMSCARSQSNKIQSSRSETVSSNMAWRLAAIAVLCASTLGADATASSDGAAGITTVVASVGGSQGELAGKDARRCVQSSIVSSTVPH
jgi:hypothetical protein